MLAKKDFEIKGVEIKKDNVFFFHVFTDDQDRWVDTFREAAKIKKQWFSEGCRNLRIYIEIYNDESEYRDTLNAPYEECVYSYGDFPS